MAFNSRSTNKAMKDVGPYLHLSWQLVLTIGLMTFIGWWLDGEFNTEPTLLVVFALLGAAIGLFTFLKQILDLDKKRREREKLTK